MFGGSMLDEESRDRMCNIILSEMYDMMIELIMLGNFDQAVFERRLDMEREKHESEDFYNQDYDEYMQDQILAQQELEDYCKDNDPWDYAPDPDYMYNDDYDDPYRDEESDPDEGSYVDEDSHDGEGSYDNDDSYVDEGF